MHTNKKIIICKFNLKKKFQFGEKCKYRHISVNEINEILASFVGLKQENESLKSVLKDKCRELSNLYKKRCHVTDYNVNVPTKPLYNSFFEKSESLDDHKVATIGKNERIDMIQSEESGIDEGIDQTITKHNLKNRNIR